MRKWHHSVDKRWMDARRDCLTATDVVSLLPEFKRIKQPGKFSPGCAALWADKEFDEVECESYNDAARGHVLEPYAVEEFNNIYRGDRKWFHWDDCLIYDDAAPGIPLAFSPDALQVEQPNLYKVPAVQYGLDMVKEVLEVKCYKPKRHMQSFIEDKMSLPQRYQIAVAMMLLESCEVGHLFFYCPSCERIPMFALRYFKDELKAEMDTVGKILQMYNNTVSDLNRQIMASKVYRPTMYTEEGIYQDMLMDECDTFFIRR